MSLTAHGHVAKTEWAPGGGGTEKKALPESQIPSNFHRGWLHVPSQTLKKATAAGIAGVPREHPALLRDCNVQKKSPDMLSPGKRRMKALISPKVVSRELLIHRYIQFGPIIRPFSVMLMA